jgi:hypothetical protein
MVSWVSSLCGSSGQKLKTDKKTKIALKDRHFPTPCMPKQIDEQFFGQGYLNTINLLIIFRAGDL